MTARSPRRPRALHPGAWWAWALLMATAASRTTNPLLLGLVLGVVAFVVANRRTAAPWAQGFRSYLVLAGVVIAVRVVFRVLLGSGFGDTVLFTLPELPLPDVAAGIRIGGPVSLEGIVAAVVDGMRLGTLLVCIGAANVLANPRRLLKAVPGALHAIATAVVVGLSVAPQLVESGQRVRRARALRGHGVRGPKDLVAVLVPVLEDAVERSLALAASMDSRGFGRLGDADPRRRRRSVTLVVGGLLAVSVGLYGVLDGTTPTVMGLPALALGTLLAGIGLGVGSRAVVRTVHRPDPWATPEWLTVAAGLVAAVGVVVSGLGDGLLLNPSVVRLAWPTLPLVPTVAVLVGALPAVLTPAPPADASRRVRTTPAEAAVPGPVARGHVAAGRPVEEVAR